MENEEWLVKAIEQEMPYCPDSDYEIGYQNGLSMAKAIALKMDAIPVVRCKDCRAYEPIHIRPFVGVCHVWDTVVKENGFCHHGERRTDERKTG